ncbi:MAG: alpha-D-ribose 1-methylphosphonate 5-phosphate C-P-lyase PhnJ [Burkholderiales bacterium]|nr:alpha-D-ribose 1-methylphosphonate 5-phosphate C-P-lyase PhnJ [Anaerolineae bacterium]
MTALENLALPREDYAYGFLDAFAKRELRRRTLKAIAIPGYQVPYASRELPIARGWGTGGLQVSLSLVGPESVIKVIDQGSDDSVNAANLRRFITRMSGAATTTDVLEATIIQSRHRIPEEVLREEQALVLQVPDPEPLRAVQSDSSKTHQMHADSDYSQLWLVLYEQLVRYKQYLQGASYPSLVNGRYVISPSPIPRWDTPKLHQAAHLTLLSAGREKRLYAVPPYTDVYPLEFSDVPFQVEDQRTWADAVTGVVNKFMNEIPQAAGASAYEVSDSGYLDKLVAQQRGEPQQFGATYYDDEGKFYKDGYLKSPVRTE